MSNLPRDFHYLCGNCGRHTQERAWKYLIWDDEKDGYRELRGDDDGSDAPMQCPVCNYIHRDGDDGPGIWEGDLDTVEKEQKANAHDMGWDEELIRSALTLVCEATADGNLVTRQRAVSRATEWIMKVLEWRT